MSNSSSAELPAWSTGSVEAHRLHADQHTIAVRTAVYHSIAMYTACDEQKHSRLVGPS